jgi:hypothetical protein
MSHRLWIIMILAVSVVAIAQENADHALTPQKLPGLPAPARIIRDSNDIAHIEAANEHDMAFLQGYIHAQDRLFQMDVSRRQASGTLAELGTGRSGAGCAIANSGIAPCGSAIARCPVVSGALVRNRSRRFPWWCRLARVLLKQKVWLLLVLKSF